MKSRRIFWIIPVACILLAVLAALRASAWIDRFLHGDAFRKLIGDQDGRGPRLRGRLRSFEMDRFLVVCPIRSIATGLPGSMVESLRADQVRADVNWRAIFQGVWRVEKIQVINFEGIFRPGSNEEPDQPRRPEARGFASLLPRRFEVREVDIAQADVRFRAAQGGRDRLPARFGVADTSRWRGLDDRGLWRRAEALESSRADVVSFRSRIQGDVFFLTDAQCRLGEAGGFPPRASLPATRSSASSGTKSTSPSFLIPSGDRG